MTLIRRYTACAVLALLTATAAAGTFEESFQKIEPAQPTSAEGKIEVLEIFWYGCPHCYSFEPYLDKWLPTKPADVEFVRMPGVLNPAWIPHARAYYTAQKLGVLDRIHMPLFQALHRDRQRIFSEEELRDFFTGNGVDGEDFDRVYRSNEIDTRVKQALIAAKAARVTGVPTIIVNGRYMTSGTLTGSFEKLLEVTDQLVALERERTGAALAERPPAETLAAPAEPAPVAEAQTAAPGEAEPAAPAAETPPVATRETAPPVETPRIAEPVPAPATGQGKPFPTYLILIGLLCAVIVVVFVLRGRRGSAA